MSICGFFYKGLGWEPQCEQEWGEVRLFNNSDTGVDEYEAKAYSIYIPILVLVLCKQVGRLK